MANLNELHDTKARSEIEGMNPSVKLGSVLLLGVAAAVSLSPVVGAAEVVCLIACAVCAGMGKRLLKVLVAFGVPISLMLLLIQGCFGGNNTTVLFDFGFAKLGLEGTMYAAKTVVTLLTFLGGLWLVRETSDVSELVADLEERGLSPKAGYLVLASLNVVPQMRKKMATIQEAQACRGLRTDGGIISRLKATVPLLGPVVLSSLTDAEQRSVSLELRGFGIEGPRTSYVTVRHSPLDRVLISTAAFVAIASVVASVGGIL